MIGGTMNRQQRRAEKRQQPHTPRPLKSGSTIAPSRQAGTRSITKIVARIQRNITLASLASRLDREADARLFLGHVAAAERLSHRAAELRAVAP